MSFSERFDGLNKGKPGAIVDEFLSESGVLLYYAYYDEDGALRVYADFKRGTSPEDIAKVLNLDADDILASPPNYMSPEEVIERVENLRELAQNVPGLRQG